MQQAGYLEFAPHKLQHEDLARRQREFQKDFEWLQKHIIESDQKYAPYLKRKAVA